MNQNYYSLEDVLNFQPGNFSSSGGFIPSIGNMNLLAEGDIVNIEALKNMQKNTKKEENNKVENNTNNSKYEIVGGRVVAKDRPKGWGRVGAGLVDWVTFGLTDRDKQGNLTGVGFGDNNTGSMHGNTGFGQSAEMTGVTQEILNKDVDRNEKGEIIGAENKDEDTDGDGDKTPKDPNFEDIYGMPFEDYLNKMEGVQARAANRKLLNQQIANLPNILAAGGMRAAESYDAAARNATEWSKYIPKYQLPQMKYAQLRDYGLG
tara:strand:- start:683 stop:1468 length:786 start_codon:yes stop_codon:yes gene_type:complete